MKSKIVYDNYDVPLMWTTGRGRLREMFSVVGIIRSNFRVGFGRCMSTLCLEFQHISNISLYDSLC